MYISEKDQINIVKINWLLCRLWVNDFDKQINLWQEYKMIACRRLIVDSRVKLDEAHYPWSIELQTKDIRARCSQLPDGGVLSIEANAIEDVENQCLHCSFKLRCKRMSFDRLESLRDNMINRAG